MLLTLLRLGTIRFAVFYLMGFLIGFSNSWLRDPLTLTIGATFCVTFSLGVELLNRWADQDHDLLSEPERFDQCRKFGFGRIRLTAWLSLGGSLLLGVALLAWRPDPVVAVLGAVSLMLGAAYSAGPRLKIHGAWTPILLTTTVTFPMVIGLRLSPAGGEWTTIGAVFVLLTCASLSTMGVKDLADVEGDRACGYDSVWPRLMEDRRWVPLAIVLLVQVGAAAVGVGIVGRTMAIAFLLPPLELLVVHKAFRATRNHQEPVVRELMYWQTLVSVGLVGIAVRPSLATGIVAGAALVAWWAASRWLHWQPHYFARELWSLVRVGP
ncbi:MAG: UbiA family prenyltransferase [Propionibacteriaceae bacterium]|jgi:4-hydroxybenzoate polyprenyltransferase|nr:UbiA family prenyltransferase [Propionibacteriaceae bacterium]